MKKLVYLLLGTGLLLSCLLPNLVLAQNTNSITIANQLTFPTTGQLFDQDDRDFTRVRDNGQIVEDEAETEGSEREVSPPKGNLLTEILPKMLNWAFFLMGSVLVIVLVYAGVLMIVSRGDEASIGEAKNIIVDVILGAVVIGLAYAIVTGLITTLANL